jgi:hypothetical protein
VYLFVCLFIEAVWSLFNGRFGHWALIDVRDCCAYTIYTTDAQRRLTQNLIDTLIVRGCIISYHMRWFECLFVASVVARRS